ncbi:MAG TPA: RES family NAD+ phosphorylase [Candidatus Sumerlaeota bacterium]|nr:RES family NAD+ phosphorylase [Candidatus Sumerlaeota bacterium]HPS01525.1 RES family NAD+ phosphorylase [Candidatus Sumerlaeota bacterium]
MYGAAPVLQFNEHHYGKSDVGFSEWLQKDVRLISDAAKIGFFHYGPRLWMIGEIEPLISLQDPKGRSEVIQRIIATYPTRLFPETKVFFRLRKMPKHPENHAEYDSPPIPLVGQGRLDSEKLPVMYGSQDLETCVHECRVTVEDDLFVASLSPTRTLKLLDLTELIRDDVSEFESIDLAVHMLFLAGEHSYEISREIATVAHDSGLDGIIYPSYFSLFRTGANPFDTTFGLSIRIIPAYAKYAKSQIVPNLALFGRPIESGTVKVNCINRLILRRVAYDIQFGPVKYWPAP